ncbi:MAG: DUF167 domain-containing protein [Polyangiaceae bacterium]|nr:DUF167 domain-containing protein [Polyangiaceae bacterium]
MRVKPRASTSRVIGLRADALEIAVAAPPVDGAANSELIATLAKWLGVPRSALSLVGGATGRRKLVDIRGVSGAEVRARCEP